MKKNKFILLLMLSLVFSLNHNFEMVDSDDGISSIIFQSDNIELEVENGKTKFKVSDLIGLTMEEGKPQMPVYSTLFQINPDKNYEIEYEVLDSYVLDNIDFENYKQENVTPYSVYPEDNLYVSKPEIMRGVVLKQIGITPYKYFSEEKKLEVYKSIKINIKESGDSDLDYFIPEKKSRVFEELYASSVINYQRSSRSSDYQTPSILYICGGSSCSNDYFEALVLWRHKQGYDVTVVSTNESGSSENAINNYISNAYYLWDNPPEIVGLVGDVGGSYNIACDYYEWGSGWNTYEGASDVIYTYIEGNDLLPEVVIGRISADSSSDLNNIINKTIEYEKAQLQTDLGWFDRSALIGDPTQSGLSCAITSQWIKEIMNAYGHLDVAVDHNGGSDSQLENFLEDNFNEGIMYYNYRGIYGSGGAYMPSNGSGLSNGYYTPFATVLTCGTGDYNYDDDSEDFIRVGSVNNPKGAVGCVGISTTGTHTAYNNILDMGMYDGIYAQGLSYAGSATTAGRLAIYETYPSNPGDCVGAFSAWTNLMGDPALHLWTATPKDFIIEGLPNQLQLGTNHIDLTIYNNDGEFVEDARVTLLMGDDVIFESEYTDSSGNVSFNWDNTDQSGFVYVTVTKRNYRPLESGVAISDDYAINISWEGNFEADAGENYTFPMISIASIGNEGISWISGELTSSSNLVDFENSTTSWIYMNDEPVGNQEPLIINVSEDAIFGDNLNLILNLTDNHDNNWSIYIPFSINSPKIDILDFLTNVRPRPGESVDLFLQVQNNGNLTSEGTTALLSSPSSLINIDNGLINFGNMTPGQISISEEVPVMSFSPSILNGSVLPVEVKITDQNYYNRSNFVNVTVGEVQSTDPLGPNPYGYYIYDSEDAGYELAPVYDWIEIDPSYGGNGQDLNLVDGGDGNNATNSSAFISLPFEFNFYGDTYNEITVSTNGWIALGRTDLLSFRNYPIPGAGGPAPMIAAFWDDLKTSSGGDVLYKFFPEGCQGDGCEYLVVEWSDMRTRDNNSEEDFQAILYNGSDTPTGDGEIKIQYKTFNNTSSGYYPEGERPDHGCYSTIGIENKFSNEALQYTFNNTYAPGASVLDDETAIFITTESPFILYGDVNGDEILNVLDVVVLLSMILNGVEPDSIGDMNQDGILNVLDVVILVSAILNT